ncbi:MAG TPA: glutathione S-transferase family protein [Gammaproteobacteria bacterium]|nr:glutathione S-transferase family protein [Gammaproteobacteria bacterium]
MTTNDATTNTQELTLYSAAVCPFAQRTRLVLAEKALPYSVQEIDLDNIPPWYRELSPTNKVPLLVRGKDRVWESTVINEYLEEVYPEPALLPPDPGRRAFARIWIDYANTQFLPWFYKLLLEQQPQRRAELAERLRDSIGQIERDGLATYAPGPYWLGAEVSLVDLAFYPFFERMPVLEHYRDFTLPADTPNLHRWLSTMAERPSVREASGSSDFYIQRYRQYADATTDSDTAREMREI